MKTTSKIFSYTARRSSYITTMSALLFIMLVEGGVFALLIAKIIPNVLINVALLGLSAAFYLLISSKLLAPLWTKHRLDAAYLQLHYGLDFRVSVPRGAIIEASPLRERIALPAARYEAEKQRFVAAFSEQGQILLRLNQPYRFRIGFFKQALADQILINVDQRDELLAALGLPTAGTQKPELLTKAQPRSNEAGKTSTMKMLAGLLQPGDGRAWIGGHDIWSEPQAAKAALGYVADRSMLYDTARSPVLHSDVPA